MYLNKLIEQDLKYYLAKSNRRELSNILNSMEMVDLASSWENFTEADRRLLFSLLEDRRRGVLLGRLSEGMQDAQTAELASSELAGILNTMPADDRADLLSRQTPGRLKDIFAAMGPEAAKETKKLLLHAPDTAGGIMTTEFTSVRGDIRAREALLNLQGRMKEGRFHNVHAVYITDQEGRVISGCSLMRLIGADPDDLMKDIATPVDNIKILAGTDIEEVSALFTHYDLLSAPVVDSGGHMIGVITIDDIVDVIRDEADEDIALMAGVDAQDFHRANLSSTLKSRLPWLILAWLGGLAAGGVIGVFEHTLEEIVALAAFIPVVMHMGGTIGVQSSTVVVRGLAMRKLEPGRIFSIFRSEFVTGVILSLMYAVLLGIVSHLRYGSLEGMGRLWLVTSAGIGSVMGIAVISGVSLPFLFKKVGADPAVATGPIITTLLDVLGLSVYFLLASVVLL